MNPSALRSLVAAADPRSALNHLRRLEATGRNTAELIRYGGLETGEEYSPYEVLASHRMYRLRRYFTGDLPADKPSIVLVPPLMMTADMYDVAPRTSAVTALHDAGIDVWVVDFGRPEKEPGGLERTIADHVFAVSEVVDEVRRATGRDVVLGGQSQGGMFSYQAAAYRRGEGIDSLVTFGSPVDTRAPLPVPLSTETAVRLAQGLVDTGLMRHLSVPGWMMRTGTRMLTPVKAARGRLAFLMQLHDREALLRTERQRRFLDSEGWTYYSGPAFADLLEQFLVQNRMLEGGFVIGDRLVTLADIDRPILTVVGETDVLGHPVSVRGIRRAAPRADVYELTLNTGHFGLIGGSTARRITWPSVADWVRWRAGQGDLPEAIVPADLVVSTRVPTAGALAQRVQGAADLGVSAAHLAISSVSATASRARLVARDGVTLVPRLARLEHLQPDSAMSLGLLLDEAARRDPDGVALLFGDRVIRRRELKHRVDSIVRGLLRLGVRQGDRVGVLMSSRPSALAVLAAISRLGAAAVLLRPDGDVVAEAGLGGISWAVADPEHAGSAPPMAGVTWCVLGGGTAPRDLPPHVIDMERIDPGEVAVPAWYRPNPTRAADVAFVLFTGEGEHTRARVITNRRWALSALGTASAAALKPADTVYSTTPLHHSSALLMAVGGAIAAGTRLALASGADPDVFWAEVRRYGATCVSYTWTSLRAITHGPPTPAERHHPIRLFFGSGMPPGLWTRVTERFAPARVLEFYASADGEAILANVAGVKVGAAGRPLPGTAEVRIAAYDPARRRLATGADGLARECDPGQIGLLLARCDPRDPARHALRGVFAAADAWQSTGDLFTRDADGDLWLAGPSGGLIQTPDGPAPPFRIASALSTIPSVDLAVAYGVPDGEHELAVAAVTVFPGSSLSPWDLRHAMRTLDPACRPRYVQVVTGIPLTSWSRPLHHPLQEAGLPRPGGARALWRLTPDRETYQQLDGSPSRKTAKAAPRKTEE
jgi:putative long chain acyl-CoA synthase